MLQSKLWIQKNIIEVNNNWYNYIIEAVIKLISPQYSSQVESGYLGTTVTNSHK